MLLTDAKEDLLLQLRKHKGYRLVVTGHSLGGGRRARFGAQHERVTDQAQLSVGRDVNPPSPCHRQQSDFALWSAFVSLKTAATESLRSFFVRFSLATTHHTYDPNLSETGVSILLTMMLLKHRKSLSLDDTDVLCYAFAPPPVFGPLHKLSGEARKAIRAFVFGNDMICRLSLASAYGLFRDLKEVDAIGVSAGFGYVLRLALRLKRRLRGHHKSA